MTYDQYDNDVTIVAGKMLTMILSIVNCAVLTS